MRPALRACVNSALDPLCSPRCSRAAHQTLAPYASKRLRSDKAASEQAHPFHGYYADMLDAPLHRVQPGTRTSPAPSPPDEPPKTEKEETLVKARVVFGSRLAGPAERRREIDKASQNVAGILVPPRPEEPDNCCMSGCANCVWDRYGDELEEWAEQSAKARNKVQEQRRRGKATGMMAKEYGMPNHAAVSMDDDGGGTETKWSGTDSFGQGGADLFADIPVGIRVFMKTEKKLKERQKRERAAVG